MYAYGAGYAARCSDDQLYFRAVPHTEQMVFVQAFDVLRGHTLECLYTYPKQSSAHPLY